MANQHTANTYYPIEDDLVDERFKRVDGLKYEDGFVLLLRCSGYRIVTIRIGRRSWRGGITGWLPLKLPPTHWMRLPEGIIDEKKIKP